MRRSTELRAELSDRLCARRGEIEEAVLARVYGIADPTDAEPAYVEGLRTAVSVALDFALEAIERGENRAPPLPTALLAQARLAARAAIPLDAVLRRYLAGYTLVGDFIIGEVEQGDPAAGRGLARLFRGHAAIFDQLLAAVSEEYAREIASSRGDTAKRRAERVERLLAGELLDASELGYELKDNHLGIVATGPRAAEAIRELAASLHCRCLLVPREEGTLWVWLGSRRPIDQAAARDFLTSLEHEGTAVALGEPAEGISGWRLTHRQAAAALPIALRRGNALVNYANVAVLASVLRDDLLVTSLRQLYLDPLEADREGGESLRVTLRAYFDADRNVSSAAASLGVSRRTVANRLKAIEARLGRRLGAVALDLELALHVDDLRTTRMPDEGHNLRKDRSSRFPHWTLGGGRTTRD